MKRRLVPSAPESGNPGNDDNGDDAMPESRTRKKKEVEALQKMGERLLEIPSEKRARLGLPDELLEALDHMDKARGRKGIRRQRQRIGVIMRRIDPEPAIAALEEMDHGAQMDAWRHRRAEEIRDSLLSGQEQEEDASRMILSADEALEELIRLKPDLERSRLNTLIRNAKKEAADQKKSGAGKKLYRMIRECLDAQEIESGESDETGTGEPDAEAGEGAFG